MPRSEYLNLRITETNEPQIRAICARLGISPDSRGAYGQAVNFAISHTIFQEDTMNNPLLIYVEMAISEAGANAGVVTDADGYPTHVTAIYPQFAAGHKNSYAIDPQTPHEELVSEIHAWWDRHCKLFYRE